MALSVSSTEERNYPAKMVFDLGLIYFDDIT